MAGRSLLSDLVRDSKLETQLLGSSIQHIFYDTGSSAKQRRVRREERWARQKFVGQGAYGRVYLEQCETGGSSRLRAVKEIKKSVTIGEEIDYMRELEAVAKFSHQKVNAPTMYLGIGRTLTEISMHTASYNPMGGSNWKILSSSQWNISTPETCRDISRIHYPRARPDKSLYKFWKG